jgi:hypothetical protein
VRTGVTDQQRRQRQPDDRVGDAQPERLRPEPNGRRDVPGRQRGDADGGVPGGLVESHRQPTLAWPDEVDLHVDRHGPRQPLIDSQQDVGGDDHPPRRRVGQQERDRQPDDPARHEDRSAGEAVGEHPRGEVGARLDQPERDDERERHQLRGEAELLGADQRQDRALQADHAADEEVDGDEQRELRPVLPQPQPHPMVLHASAAHAEPTSARH